jgi:hypothetical protein
MIETLGLFILMGMANHQVAQIVTTGVVFDTFRAWAHTVHPKLGYLFTCHLCFGTWVGMVMAAVVGLTVHENAIVSWGLVAFGTAMLGRFFNEVLALIARHVRATEAQAVAIEETNAQQRRMFEAQGD